MRTTFLSLLSLLGVLGSPLCGNAVTLSTPKLSQNSFKIEIKEPYQSFCCKDARKISHISLQKYIATQKTATTTGKTSLLYVAEVTLDFESSPLQVRIYAMEEFDPLRIIKNIKSVAHVRSRTKRAINSLTKSNVTDVADYLVAKTYPDSTHAKTIEFRIQSIDEVDEFYELFMKYYLRERQDACYFGEIESPNARVLSIENFLGIKQPSPADDWLEAMNSKKVLRSLPKIIVSGLSGLCFTLGTADTVATEIERQDVNKK